MRKACGLISSVTIREQQNSIARLLSKVTPMRSSTWDIPIPKAVAYQRIMSKVPSGIARRQSKVMGEHN